VWTVLGSQTSEVDTYYDTVGYGLPTQVNEYDWGPTLSRTTITAYDYNTSCGVTNTNVVDLPCSVRIENSSGGTVASTTYTYDSNGDMLSETPLAGPAFAFTYNSNGTMKTSADPSGTTTYSYGSNSCNAFADTTTPPISSLATTAVWSCNPAVMTSSKDANGNQTSYAYNDPFNRLTSTTYPDGGSVTITYNSETGTTTTTKITSAVSRTDTTYLDGLGRVLHQTVAGVITNLSYDSLGRVATVGIANSGAQDTYSYDALNRVTKATHADSTNAQTSYSNNCATTTDEASKVRGICTDGLGRTSVVTEDPNGLDYQTSYSYDVLNDLTGVSQASESRSYYYDGLGRITQSTTPDAGTVNYSYDSDSTCSITSAGDLVKRVDARSIRTCYAYDSMHRLTQKNYSDGTATANYYYDQSSYNGLAISNGLGRNTGMSDGSGETAWSYDAMGRALTEEKTIASITKTVGYTYNYDGSLASITYPSGRKITYGVDSLGRPQPAQDTTNGINYAGSATYAAQGALASVLNGETSSFGGITYSIGYNNRLWPSSISASSSNGTALSLAYSTYYPNGNVEVITNNRDNGRTVTYGYDSLNRINSASSQATSGADCWGQAIPSTGYDRYGNLLTITVTKCTALALSISVNGNNQVSGFSYDAAGDVTNDGTYTYAWDAEGRLKSAAGVTYTYDRAGQRVEKSSGTLYWLGTGASVLAETDTSGNTLNEYIFFAGMRVARRDGSGNIYYYFQDRMGTNRTIAYGSGSNPGALCYDADFYPFGGELAFTNNCAQNYKFAGMERDPETLNDHTLFRSYRSNYGRWLSPDPGDLAAADPTNPQSWNRYAYVLDNPVNVVDPRGLDGCTYSSEDGIWDCPPPSWAQASFSGLPPQPSNQPTASNNWLNSTTQGGDWGSCAPTGLSNSCTPGANPWSGELSSGFQQVVNLIKNDINENLGLNAQAASADMNIIQYGSMDDFLAAVSALELIQQLMAADQNALGLLQSWQPGATGNPPNASGKCSAVGPILAQWANALRACTKAHPGQAPPPSLATPPNVNGVC
jgi:RHS repeat-associated protein